MPLRLFVRAAAACLWVLVVASLILGTTMAPEIEIMRDSWGIPHIFAASDEGAMFGLGYVSAQDRMLQMEYCRRIVQGRISEMLGLVGSQGKTTLDSDIKYRHMGTYAHLETVAANLDEETRGLLQAYAAGVNHYLETTRSLHPLFAEFGIVPEPWRPTDCLAVWNRIATFFSPSWSGEAKRLHDYEDLLLEGLSESEATEQLSTERILDEAAAVVQLPDADPSFLEALDVYVADLDLASKPPRAMLASETIPTFSHAWVVGGERTTTGAAVLNSDPQTTVRNPSVWYEAYVSGETFVARGIGVAGCPGFLIGWNESVAWGVTALGADLADTFRLELSTSQRNAYVYDDIHHPIETWQETIPVRGGRSTVITVKRTQLGPVVSELMTDRRRNEEYVLRTIDQEYEDQHSVQALFAMMRSQDAHGFATALEPWTSPGVHCLFGDSEGTIGYWTLADIPVRSSLSPFGGQATQDGSTSAAGWLDIIPHALLPHVFDPASGTLFSANHLPVGSWYPLPLGIGTGGSGDSQRSWRLRELLSGDEPLSPEDVQAIHFDDVNAAIRSIVRAGYHAEAMKQALSPNTILALESLREWYAQGAHCDTSDPSFVVAYHIPRGFRQPQAGALYERYGGGDGGLCFFLKDLNSKLDVNSDMLLDAAELAFIDASLADSWSTVVTKYGSDETRWQQNFASSTATLALPYGVNLEGFPSLDRALDLVSRPLPDPEGATIWAQKGNSYSQWVDLADVDRSLAVLPIGISESPDSPYFAAEQELWETGILRAAPLSRDMIEANEDASILLSFPGS